MNQASKQIEITPTFRVRIDSLGNHQPIIFKEGGEEIKIGKQKGQITKDRWQSEDWYFSTLSKAIHYGVKNGFCGLEEPIDEVPLKDYLQWLRDVEARTLELVREQRG